MDDPNRATTTHRRDERALRGTRSAGRAMPHGFTALSAVLFALAALAAGSGLLVDGTYRDNLLVRAGWVGNDLVTLALALPLLAASTGWARRGSPRAALAWCGVAAYLLYDYAFYAFGAAFNGLFLVYVGILVAATCGLVVALSSPLVRRAAAEARLGSGARWVAVLVGAVSLALGGFWVATSAAFWWSGEAPPMVAAVDHPTNVTGALDLWLVVSSGLLGGVWLWRGRAWGYVIATVWSVKGLLYMTAITAAALVQHAWGAAADLAQLVLWPPIGMVCLACSWILLRTRVG